MTAEAKATPPLCTRCKEQDGVLGLRSETVCETCFTTFVASKAIKRLEVLQRETRGPRLPSRPQRYLLALSRRPSSTALLHILNENLRRQRERNQRLKFELVPVFVDVDVTDQPTASSNRTAVNADTATSSSSLSSASSDPTSKTPDAPEEETTSPTDAFTAHFPELPIHKVPLSSILSSRAIDWTSLPPQDPTHPPSQRLTDLFTNLPTASARADVSRLLVRHALFAAAATHDCGVVLLGYNTTSLAELTLSEAAKGRGFGIPWLVNDGAFPLPRAIADDPAPTDLTSSSSQSNGSGGGGGAGMIQIYSPLREIFRKEILTYLSIVSSAAGPLAELFPASAPSRATAVVSHRDLSLDDVVARYFADVEASYPSVVANVVRTTGKLNRASSGGRQCRLCGGGLDPLGDERWKGEIGEADATILSATDDNRDERPLRKSMLCYGCDRSVKG
ncbi:hypothetical protein FHL15_006626 [Xylaria flabelliformis]|uniref:Cytoplasmic tRNA 2-thiolation protein 2 n=1 Tax=Xylaria flabelliformis TaxID=2512241 RepID=A0A553HWX5_9PEZI|nr:hypothetical protein FHL15_006626 [Xylaria flabelliformis]